MDHNPGKCPKNTQASGQLWYFFNKESGLCEEFLYYGCAAGNQNRFYSLYQVDLFSIKTNLISYLV
jgi:hypothetical protein